ncbi:MAG: serine/threonine-protein kinase [Pseudomonadota bacterium]
MASAITRRLDRSAPHSLFHGSCLALAEDLLQTEPTGRVLKGESGRYRVGEALGHGGMATVHRALTLTERRLVAIKFSRLEVDREVALELARREAACLRRIAHPAVVRLLDVVDDPCHPALVLEHIEGPTLREFLDGGEVQAVGTIFLRLLQAIAACHEAGVIHGDIKPQNVLLRGPLDPVLIDFGIANTADRRPALRTRGHTPRYAAPEQLAGGDATPASDVFQLGVLCFELLTGRRPHRHACGRVAQSIAFPRGLPRRLRRLLKRALDPAPGRRFESAGALLDALSPNCRSVRLGS